MTQAHDFETLFEGSDDPWHFRTRWYEERKRQLTLACLPAARYASAFEPGCANGELSAALSGRCDRLLAWDGAAAAVAVARRRLVAVSNVTVEQSFVPQEWPKGLFDLIVISELGYYLHDDELNLMAVRAKESLSEHGAVLACHWRPRIEGCHRSGEEVHTALDAGLHMPRMLQHIETDFCLDVWSIDSRSVAAREGIA